MFTMTIIAQSNTPEDRNWQDQLYYMYTEWLLRKHIAYQAYPNLQSFSIDDDTQREAFICEVGSHRQVATSPFDPLHRRQTSFAEVRMSDVESNPQVIRSYVTTPYTQITDFRTGVTTENVFECLQGDIDIFIDAGRQYGIEQGYLEDIG